jgi:hypothetical protein
MAGTVTTYDAQSVSIIVNGTYLTGLSEDMVSVSKDEDSYETTVGAQGDVVRSKVNNPLGTISVTLQQTSPQIAMLNSIAKSGALVPVSVINAGPPRETVTSTQAFIKKPADREYSASAGDREFEFQCLDLDFN